MTLQACSYADVKGLHQCLPSLHERPYLLEEEETYEPPEDPDSGLTLEELGMRALQRLPRDRALDGIRAFNEMRCALQLYCCVAG